jgi:hypothetical protein
MQISSVRGLNGLYLAAVSMLLVAAGSSTDELKGQEADKPAQSAADEADSKKTGEVKKDVEGWRPLLPEKGLEGWEITDFGTTGKVYREGEQLIIESGEPLNGITYKKKDFPTDRFEISLEAQRIEGNDFLCGLTFPVGDEFCSFIAGGWGGGLVGLSSVDGFDASENSTSTYFDFENGKWYTFRVRVDPEMIRAWIDDKEFFRLEREGHEFSTRLEVYASQPLGFCAFQSKVAVKDFKWRPIEEGSDSPQTPEASSREVASPVEPVK